MILTDIVTKLIDDILKLLLALIKSDIVDRHVPPRNTTDMH